MPVGEFLGVIRRAMLHSLREEALSGVVLSDSSQLKAYLVADLAHAAREEFRVLFLDTQNRLLADERTGIGSAREVAISTRQIISRALELRATALILVHNHPSGDATPSGADIATTRLIVDCGRALDIMVHDHLIVARSGMKSFRLLGLM